MSDYLKTLRKWMWLRDPHCEKCGVELVLPESVPGKMNGGRKQIKVTPDNMATIQHKYDRFSGLRWMRSDEHERVHFLWCNKCNWEDGVQKQKEYFSSLIKNNNMNTDEAEVKLEDVKGAFGLSLLRNGAKIKQDRAITILMSSERYYRRKVEDLVDKIRDLQTARSGALDLSPTDINSLVLASDFDSAEFYAEDRKFTLAIREARVELEEMRARYEFLFGPFTTAGSPLATVPAQNA